MTKEYKRKELKIFFLYGIVGFLCALLFTWIIFFCFSMRFKFNGIFNYGILISSFFEASPYLAIGLFFYCVGFCFRGRERKSFTIDLEEKDDNEKWILLGIITKSMKKGPSIPENKGVPPRFYPGN